MGKITNLTEKLFVAGLMRPSQIEKNIYEIFELIDSDDDLLV